MKILVTYILISISFYAIGQRDESIPITKVELLTVDSNIVFEHFEDVQVYQFFDDDSLKEMITHSRQLDSNENIIAEYYKDYKTDKANGRVDVLVMNEYNHTNQLIISIHYFESFKEDEVQKTFYYYNGSLLARTETFELRKRLKPNVDKGFGRSGGCIITSEDYEDKPTWKVIRIVLYEYDKFGRKKLRYSPVFRSSHNRYEYQYDSNGNMIVEKSLDESKLIYTEKYQYKLNQTITNLQWNNKDWGGTKRIKTFDDNGNLIKEVIFKKDKKWVDVYEYNAEDKLIRFIAYGSDGNISLTHRYKYKK